MALIYFALFALLGAGCQKKPALAPAADPYSTLAPPPMGATTYNDELKKELMLLDKLLAHSLDAKILANVKEALLEGKTKNRWAENSQEAYLVKVFLALPELVYPKEIWDAAHKLWYRSKFLFLRRRFIEAAIGMSEVLKLDPGFSRARNWRARAIFFLGNPDLATSELNKIVESQAENSEAHLDALYLIGAIVYESNDPDPKRIKPGIDAWQKYLKRTPTDQSIKNEINKSLAELTQRLKGENTKLVDLFLPSSSYNAQKNAVLQAFKEENLTLATKLCDQVLRQNYDKDLAVIKARIFIKNGRMDEASLLFDKIIEKDKSYAPGFHYRGMALMMKGQIKEAIASWQEVLKLDKAYAQSHNLEHRIQVAQGMQEN
jgi:tetratricopeptide (TPR) repeat protein